MTMIIGHRGARNLWPENSLTGFRNLLELDVEGVEFDVHLTRAGELLVMHDATLDRTAEGQGAVVDLAPGEHRGIVLKHSADTIPSLDDVLAVLAKSKFELHIELKADAQGRHYAGLEALAAAAVDRFGLSQRAFLTSFSVEVLQTVNEVAPHLRRLSSYDRVGADAEGVLEGLLRRLAVADVVAIEKSLFADHWDLITSAAPLQRLGVWVPNSRSDQENWLHRGLRQITTDNPDISLDVRAGRGGVAVAP